MIDKWVKLKAIIADKIDNNEEVDAQTLRHIMIKLEKIEREELRNK